MYYQFSNVLYQFFAVNVKKIATSKQGAQQPLSGGNMPQIRARRKANCRVAPSVEAHLCVYSPDANVNVNVFML